MNLLSRLAILFLMTTVFGESVEELWEQDAESMTIDTMQLQARFDESTVKSGKRIFGKSDTYSSVQTHTPDDTAFAKSLQTRIVGGTVARHGEIPWQASVIILKINKTVTCGASIIDQFWLVSAAHCFTQAVQVNVTVGDFNLSATDIGEQRFTVSTVYIHEDYGSTKFDNDIALLRINPSNNGRGIVFNKFVQPIQLSDAGTYLKEGTILLVSGWGWTHPCINCTNGKQVLSQVLKKTEIPIFNQRSCQRLFHTVNKVTSRMFCAGFSNVSTSACHGDSGGPAVYKTKGQYVLYGIVSWGTECGQPGLPTVYTRVTSFLPWIKSKMQF